MNPRCITVNYHSRRMLSTIDLQQLFDTLFDAYGDGISIEIVEMNEQEKSESTELVEGLQVVRDRFEILESILPGNVRRRKDLEQLAIALGKK